MIFFSSSSAEHPHLKDINFTKDDLEEAIEELSADSAASPDALLSFKILFHLI